MALDDYDVDAVAYAREQYVIADATETDSLNEWREQRGVKKLAVETMMRNGMTFQQIANYVESTPEGVGTAFLGGDTKTHWDDAEVAWLAVLDGERGGVDWIPQTTLRRLIALLPARLS